MFCAIFLLLLLAPAASLEIICGHYHNCVFERGQGAMKCWGTNADKQLGYGDANNRGNDANEMGSNLPLLNIGTGFTVEDMNLGLQHSCAMSVDRAMKCFGSNAYSQLGFDGVTTTSDALPFLEIGVDFNLSKIAAGLYHTCVLSTDAALKCFGYNYYGQCGAGTTTTPISGPPSQINAIDFGTNFTPVDVSTFNDHVCVLSQQQTVKCFGRNDFGQLGYGDTTQRGKTPESMGDGLPIVDLGSDFIVAAIATGRWHTCALSTTKTVKCWGNNESGQCGTPHSTETGDNLPVLEFGAGFVPMQLALGGYHTCILSESATLICFGRNWYGQLGIGNTTNVGTPGTLTGIDLGSNFVPRRVAVGWMHMCAVSTGDAIKCFGYNAYGQLGLGHTDDMGDGPNEMGDNLPFVDVCLDCTEAPTTATSAPTTAPTTSAPTTSKQPTVSPSTTASPSTEPTHVPTTQPTTKQPSTFSPTTASPSATMASTHEPSTSSPTPPPVTVSTAAQTTTTTTLVTPTVAETTAASPSPSSAATTSSTPTQTIVIIAACASALFVAVVCICAAAFYYVRKNYVRKDRRLRVNEADNDAEVRVPPPGVVAYARENALVEDTRGEDNLSLPAQESVLSVDARRRENIELAIAEVRVVAPGVFVHASENVHVEDTRGEDNLSLPAQESVLCVDDGIAQNEGRRQSRVSQLQNHGVDATTTTQTTVTTSGATSGIDPSLGVYELNLMVDL